MNLTLIWQLAWRYLRGKRSANAVPILSRISMFAIAVGAAAMIILFSVFNGFEGIVRDLYKAFYPEIKITSAKGKFYTLSDDTYNQLSTVDGIATISRVIEDNVLLSTGDAQRVATLKGVDGNYFKVNSVAPYITDGVCRVGVDPVNTAIAGSQLLAQMDVTVNNPLSKLQVYYPNSKASASTMATMPQNAFRSLNLRPDGEFTVQDEFDSKYILSDIGVVQDLVQEEDKYSSLELLLQPDADPEDIQEQLQAILGAGYIVATRYEQNKTLYMVMRAEKWAVYGILLLVLMIAAFNMIGALSLLVLEKQKDISILKAMGARKSTVNAIFLAEGVLWSLLGGGIGLLLGGALCFGQQQFGWVKLGGAFIISAYPVQIHWQDFALIIVTIIVIGILAAWFPAMRAAKVQSITLKSD